MIHNNHDRFLEEKRKRAVKRRLIVCVFLLIILFSIIKVKKDRQEYAEEKRQAEIAHEKKASQQQSESEEKPVKKEKTDEEVFEEIRKNENIFSNTFKRNELLHNLEIYAKYNPNAKLVMKNADDIHPSLLKLAGNNYTAVNFVAKTIDPTVKNEYSYTEKANKSNVPLYLQWDKRWGYEKYGYGIIGFTGCGPTSCAMAMSYLKNDPSITPAKIAEESDRNGFSSSEGTSWGFYPYIARKYGLKAVQMDENYNVIKENVKKGNPILISVRPGDFTRTGHVMVISGMDSNGNIILNDPNSFINSQKTWKYDRLRPQIKAMWVFSNGV